MTIDWKHSLAFIVGLLAGAAFMFGLAWNYENVCQKLLAECERAIVQNKSGGTQ